MLFNSLQFLAFFPVVVAVYWLLPQKLRNLFLLIASYYFYMSWEPAYALLILFSSITTYLGALYIEKWQKHKKRATAICIVANLLMLFVFKYLGFAGEILRDCLGINAISLPTLLLPVGISFYAFQTIGYIIDVHRGEVKAERNLLIYMLFVAFFPQLVAGPIERAKNMLPQLHNRHIFNGGNLICGIYIMMWGYFMKLCVAENVSAYVDTVFRHVPEQNGTSLLMAAFFFTFQVFSDFGGYSLIAIGAARCMGFILMTNFRHPYLSLSVRDFWRRWHISLTSWFTNYVYIPLGGNRCSAVRHKVNILVTFIISGLWHGANYTFLIWGAYHGILMLLYSLKTNYLPSFSFKGRWGNAASMLVTFCLVMVGWVFFKAKTVDDAVLAICKIFSSHGELYIAQGRAWIAMPLVMIAILMIKEWRDERKGIDITQTKCTSLPAMVAKTVALAAAILLCANFNGKEFIYFQF